MFKDCPHSLTRLPTNNVSTCFACIIRFGGVNCTRCSLDINLFPQHLPRNILYSPKIPILILALVPINLYPDSDVVGPTSLNAINFITLGIPSTSEYGEVTVEAFTLENGWLFENSELSVHFTTAGGFEKNEFGVSESSVLKAGECNGGCGEFCVDREGYLVSVTPLGISVCEVES